MPGGRYFFSLWVWTLASAQNRGFVFEVDWAVSFVCCFAFSNGL